MPKPIVAIVGRPNVGKSTLFNKLVGRRVSIVEDTPGVTRDRIYADCEWQLHRFSLVDTGGIDPRSEDPLLTLMRKQAELAIATADVILFVVDGKEGITGMDMEVADMLRRVRTPIVLAVNKLDNTHMENESADFYELGLGVPIVISSVNMLGFGDLLDAIAQYFPDPEAADDEHEEVRIAVVGRPNVGKSSLVNRILGQERTMVSDIPGTTRDAVDTPFEHEGGRYVIVDTAGIRRKARIEDATLERYSVIRSLAAIRRADVVLVLIDAQDGITEQDIKIAGYVHEEGKACAILVNKWDAVDKETGTLERFRREVLEALKFMDYAPVHFISALTGQRVGNIMGIVRGVNAAATLRVTTGVLNEALHDAVSVNPPPTDHGRRLKIYYATQRAVRPPTFIFFVNEPELMHYSYERYLQNHFRKTFPLEGTPIRFMIRARAEE